MNRRIFLFGLLLCATIFFGTGCQVPGGQPTSANTESHEPKFPPVDPQKSWFIAVYSDGDDYAGAAFHLDKNWQIVEGVSYSHKAQGFGTATGSYPQPDTDESFRLTMSFPEGERTHPYRATLLTDGNVKITFALPEYKTGNREAVETVTLEYFLKNQATALIITENVLILYPYSSPVPERSELKQRLQRKVEAYQTLQPPEKFPKEILKG